jgi:hypothetical protein
MASSDASAFGRKNVAYRITFPILDADGDLVTGATGLDSEVSKDGGTFAECTNEATEIATSSGVYYLDLTSTEMNADTVAVIVKTTSSGAKTTTLVIYPLEDGDIIANTTQVGGQTASASGTVTFPASISSLTAAGVRSELAVELGRIDTNIGSRLSSAGYTAPLSAADTRTAIGLASANLDTQFAALPLASDWTSTRAAYLDSVLLAFNSNRTVQVTASHHVAAVLHDCQAGAINAAAFGAGAIDAAALATSAAAEIAGAVLTTAMTESYRATNAAPTLAQAAFELIAHMGDASISGTLKTLRKLDGTTAKTFTLDSATTPTSITETT